MAITIKSNILTFRKISGKPQNIFSRLLLDKNTLLHLTVIVARNGNEVNKKIINYEKNKNFIY